MNFADHPNERRRLLDHFGSQHRYARYFATATIGDARYMAAYVNAIARRRAAGSLVLYSQDDYAVARRAVDVPFTTKPSATPARKIKTTVTTPTTPTTLERLQAAERELARIQGRSAPKRTVAAADSGASRRAAEQEAMLDRRMNVASYRTSARFDRAASIATFSVADQTPPPATRPAPTTRDIDPATAAATASMVRTTFGTQARPSTRREGNTLICSALGGAAD